MSKNPTITVNVKCVALILENVKGNKTYEAYDSKVSFISVR